MTPKRVRRSLREARRSRTLVVVRRRKDWDDVEGYIAGVGKKWVALGVLDGNVRPDGVVLVRLRDVRRVRRVSKDDRLQRASLAHRNLWPPATMSPQGLDRTRDLVRELGAAPGLLSVFVEREDPDVCFIGQVAGVRRKHVRLQQIDPRARWDGELTRYFFSDVTRLDVRDGYQATLLEVGGPPPVIKRRKRSS